MKVAREVVGDVYMIAERLREFDPDLFLVGRPGRYEVWRRHETVFGDRPQKVLVWKQHTLDERLIRHLRFGDMWSGQVDHLQLLEEADQKRERDFERTVDEICAEAANRLAKAVKKALHE